MIDIKLQLILLFFNFIYGMFFYIGFILFKRFLISKYRFIKILFSLLLIFIYSFIYLIINYYLSKFYIHSYFLISFFLGFTFIYIINLHFSM